MPLHHFLTDLAVVLVVAALTAVLFQRLRLPVVLGYLLAGFLVGPKTPPHLVADEATIQTLSELGVILLMFSIGLQFRVRQVVALAPTAGLTAAVEVSFMLALGYLAGQLLGWGAVGSFFAGGVVAISSTAIVAKVFEERPPSREFQEFLYAVLVFDDLAAVFLITVLTAIGAGGVVTVPMVGRLLGGLAVVLLVMLAGGMLVVPRAVRAASAHWKHETMLVASVGLCFGMAAIARAFGYSVALGAFLAGCFVAESGTGRQVEREVRPVRDMFAAIFFVAVGMQFDVKALVQHWPLVLGFALLVMIGKLVGVSVGAFLAGRGVRGAVQTGLSMAQIGEFSFVIAAVGLKSGSAPPELFAVAIAVSAITAFTTPWFVKHSEDLALFVDRKLPHPLQTFASLYGSWTEILRNPTPEQTPGSRVRRLVRLLLLDAFAVLVIVLSFVVLNEKLPDLLAGSWAMSHNLAPVLLVVGTVVLFAPFVLGIVAVSRRLGLELAAVALPRVEQGRVDNAVAPRRLLALTLQIAAVLLVGVPLVAMTQPFLPPFGAVVVLLGVLALLGTGFYRSARELQGHLQAGAELVASVLAKQSTAPQSGVDMARRLLPGIGDFTAAKVGAGSEADGQTLASLNLRGRTGATVLALLRGDQRIPFPEAGERLDAGDLVALTGSHEAISAATVLLASGKQEDH